MISNTTITGSIQRKVLLLDNYDSFTFNLYQLMGEILEEKRIGFQLDVLRNDERSFLEIRNENYTHIIISPGPGHPGDPGYFGVSADILKNMGEKERVLGICLGMQGMATCFGGNVVRAKLPMHGKISPIHHDGKGIFLGLTQGIDIMRYHSLVAEEESLPDVLEITSRTTDSGEIMGLRHKTKNIEGVQFHPESFASEEGKELLRNFLREN
jgi:anthranilate synthase component 2